MSFVMNLWVLFIDNVLFDTARIVCRCSFHSHRINTGLLHCVVYLLVGSPNMFRTDLIAHLQGTGIDCW
jgi:hypothetical protein